MRKYMKDSAMKEMDFPFIRNVSEEGVVVG